MTQPTTTPTPAPRAEQVRVTVGRYTVEPHVDPERYHDWYVTRTDSMTPGYSGFIEGRASDEASARRLAAGLACLDACGHLLAELSIELPASDESTRRIEELVKPIRDAVRFARERRKASEGNV